MSHRASFRLRRTGYSAALFAALLPIGCGAADPTAELPSEDAAQEAQALGSFTRQMTFSMTDLLRLGRVVPTVNTTFDIGSLTDVFDGDTGSLARTPSINPLVI